MAFFGIHILQNSISAGALPHPPSPLLDAFGLSLSTRLVAFGIEKRTLEVAR